MMRSTRFVLAGLSMMASLGSVMAEVAGEQPSVATMSDPQPHWFILNGGMGAYVFDGDTGEMQGKLNTSFYTAAVRPDMKREMVYVPASYYSRGNYGERTDVIVFNDFETLGPVAEVVIPNKLAAIGHQGMNNLIGGRFLGAFNLAPGMSVSIVDVQTRTFIAEISTAGCAMVFPVPERRFMQICADGTLQLITLDRRGAEAARTRSDTFFDLDEDPVFDYAVPSADGWILVSFEGMVREVTFDDGIEIGEPWSLLTEEDAGEKWRIGGNQPMAFNEATGTLLTLMHQGEKDTHEDSGTEIWGFDISTKRRGYRLKLEAEASGINVTRDEDPLMFIMSSLPRTVLVHNARTGRLLRTIEEAGIFSSQIQRFQ